MVRVFRVVHVTYEDDAERVGAQASTPLMPDLILDLLAAYLDANRVPFRYTVSSKYDQHIPDVCDANGTLASLSLVKQSWAGSAQQYLRRRITVDQYTLEYVLFGTQLGPWVRELSLRVDVVHGETLQHLCQALDHCPNITHLHLDNLNFNRTRNRWRILGRKGAVPDVLGQIAKLKRLEHLWLYQSDTSRTSRRTVQKLFAMIKDLPSLRSLSLKFWGSGSGLLEAINGTMVDFTPETDPAALLETLSLNCSLDGLLLGGGLGSTHASASLETLSLNGSLDGLLLGGESELREDLAETVVDSTHASATLESLSLTDFQDHGLLTWFLNPRNGNRIHRLELSCNDLFARYGGEVNMLFWSAMLARITKLQLVNYRSAYDLGFLEEFFPSLRSLSLCTSTTGAGMPPGPIKLPNSVRDFYFYFHNVFPDMTSPDRSALATLQAAPNVQRMVVTYAPYEPVSKEYIRSLFKDTIEYAAMNIVDFEVTEVEGPPHFLDL